MAHGLEKVGTVLGKSRDGSTDPLLGYEIDRLVYQLYGLTEEEIRIVEGKK